MRVAGFARAALRRLKPLMVAVVVLTQVNMEEVAGQTRTLDPGTRVRVRLERQTRSFIAHVTELRPDTLVLARTTSQLDPRTPFAVSDIAELEVSDGRRRLTVIGAGIGLLTGMVVTASYNGIVQGQCFSDCPERVSLLLGAAAGGVAFGTGFYFVSVERWLRIALPGRAR
jgi:hypothetical protein